MKKGQRTILFTLAVFLVSGISSTAFAQALIKNIRFDSSTPTVDRIIFELSGPYLPTGKALPGSNPRVYFDFPEAAPAPKVKNRIATDGNFIKQIRHAYHKSPKPRTRVVFDLAENKKMDFAQDFDENTNTLTISLYPAGTKPGPAPAEPPEPEPTVAKQTAPAPAVPPEPKPTVAAKPASQPAQGETGKKIQPIAEVSIPPKPEPKPVAPPPPPPKPEPEVAKKEEPPAPPKPEPAVAQKEEPSVVQPPAPAKPEPPVQAAVPEPKPEAVPEQKPAPLPETPQVASIPKQPAMEKSVDLLPEEATEIKPMAEIGAAQEEADVAPILHSIEFDPNSKRGETISFKLNGFHPPVVFGIEEDVPRIVCFFKNAAAGEKLRDVIGTRGQHVRAIKVGKYQNPDNIRVVLELSPGYNYDLQQVFFKDDNVFMLIVNKAGRKEQSTNT